MKKIYLTFDIEPIVSRFSFNPNIYTNVILGSFYLANELSRRELKATFFISLSPKTNIIDLDEYLNNIKTLIRMLSSFKNLKLQPHLHMKNLPLSFDTSSDKFSDYTLEEQVEALTWAKSLFLECGVSNVNCFRPGSYSTNKQYYHSLEQAGYQFSSVLKNDSYNYDMRDTSISKIENPYMESHNILEYPVTTLRVKSIKQTQETLNLSPDFFSYQSVSTFIDQASYLNINFHSFSVFSNRFSRENHQHQLAYNLKYFFIEKPLLKILKLFNYELIDNNTVFRHSFNTWLTSLEQKNIQTFFIGE